MWIQYAAHKSQKGIIQPPLFKTPRSAQPSAQPTSDDADKLTAYSIYAGTAPLPWIAAHSSSLLHKFVNFGPIRLTPSLQWYDT